MTVLLSELSPWPLTGRDAVVPGTSTGTLPGQILSMRRPGYSDVLVFSAFDPLPHVDAEAVRRNISRNLSHFEGCDTAVIEDLSPYGPDGMSMSYRSDMCRCLMSAHALPAWSYRRVVYLDADLIMSHDLVADLLSTDTLGLSVDASRDTLTLYGNHAVMSVSGYPSRLLSLGWSVPHIVEQYRGPIREPVMGITDLISRNTRVRLEPLLMYLPEHMSEQTFSSMANHVRAANINCGVPNFSRMSSVRTGYASSVYAVIEKALRPYGAFEFTGHPYHGEHAWFSKLSDDTMQKIAWAAPMLAGRVRSSIMEATGVLVRASVLVGWPRAESLLHGSGSDLVTLMDAARSFLGRRVFL